MQSRPTKNYMNVTPKGYRVRSNYIPLQVENGFKISRLYHPMQESYGTWSGVKSVIHRKLKEAILKDDKKRMLQMYKILIIMIENNQYSNYMNSFDAEFKMPVIPDFENAMIEFKNRMM